MNTNRLYIVNKAVIFSCDKEGRLLMELPVGEETKTVRIDKTVAVEMANVLNKMYLQDN
jgi:hypothetical protein